MQQHPSSRAATDAAGHVASFGVSRRTLIASLAVLASLAQARAAAGEGDPLAVLVKLMRARLDLIVEVAKSKWNSGTSVEDLRREKDLLDAVVAAAPSHGLDPVFATTFFRAQIEAAKLVESALIAEWALAHAPAFANVPDQKTFIRPEIDRLTGQLLEALGAVRAGLKPGDAGRVAAASRQQDVMTQLAMTRALQPLLELCGAKAGSG